jgi:hypothetical protein
MVRGNYEVILGQRTRFSSKDRKTAAGPFLDKNRFGLDISALELSPIGRGVQKRVIAEEFLLQDRSGNILARLGQYGFGDTCRTLIAKQNVSVTSLCVQDEEGASLDLHNLKNESRVMITPAFHLYEPKSRVLPALVMSERDRIIYRIPPEANSAKPF